MNVTISESGPRKVRRVRAQYRGIRYIADMKLWRAKIKINGVNHILGYFVNEIDAARAYSMMKYGTEPEKR